MLHNLRLQAEFFASLTLLYSSRKIEILIHNTEVFHVTYALNRLFLTFFSRKLRFLHGN